MKEQIKRIISIFLRLILKLFKPILGEISLSKENRISIELNNQAITICKINSKKKVITHYIYEEFNFENPDTNIENNQKIYSSKIYEILVREKLIGLEANIILPTSEVSLKTFSIPIMDQDIMDQQVKNPEFWKEFTDLPEQLDETSLSHQIIYTNKVAQQYDVLLAFCNKKKIETINKLLKEAGVNPTLYEPKCLSILNVILANQKTKEREPVALFEYGEKENYFLLSSADKLVFLENPVRKEDVVLIEHLEKVSDASGPFWSEVIDRYLNVVKAGLEETKGIKGFDLKEIFVHTEGFGKSLNYIEIIRKKIPEIRFQELTTLPLEGTSVDAKNLLEDKFIKLKANVREIMEKMSLSKGVGPYANIGSSIRFLNPYDITEPIKNYFKINLHFLSERIIKNKKIKTQNRFLNMITLLFLVLFSSIIGLKAPEYINKSRIVNEYQTTVSLYDQIYEDIKNKNVHIQKIDLEKKLASKILTDKDQFAWLIAQTPSIVPKGVKIDKIEYQKGEHVTFQGVALSDVDLNEFLKNLSETLGNSELTTMSMAEVNLDQEIETSQEKEGEVEQMTSLSNSVRLKNFSIKVNLKRMNG